jgi:hypothetical protein
MQGARSAVSPPARPCLRPLQTYTSAMDADAALMCAWGLGMDGGGWSDSVMGEAERLLPNPS